MKRKMMAVALFFLVAAAVAVALAEHPSSWESLVRNGFFPGGTIEQELSQVKSPDGHSLAVLFHREKLAPGGPPEPPKTLERWARLKIQRDGKTVYDSGYENLNIYQMSPGFALDVAWSPDSGHLAYRHITSLRIVGLDGKATAHDVIPKDSVISSFRWIDNERLLVVSKKTNYPLDMHGKPYMYQGYIDQAKDICITRADLAGGKTERYRQILNKPTLLFHAIDFCLDEISPKADRVAFSDGANLCVYDDTAGEVVAQVKIPQKAAPKPAPAPNYPPNSREEFRARVERMLASKPAHLEGVWWQTNDTVVIAVGVLGCPDNRKEFYTFDIPSKVLTDRTSILRPVWLQRLKTHLEDPYRLYRDPDWFRSAMK